MHTKFFKTVLIGLFIGSMAQAQENPLQCFKNLVSKKWTANGKWGDGTKFSQTIQFNFALDSTIVIAESYGYIDSVQTKKGHRNHGVRWYDTPSKKIVFTEYDVFGGVTNGEITNNGKNMYYNYDYYGSKVTDAWEFVNDSTYNFKVGSYENGSWKAVYLKTVFNGTNKTASVK